MKKEPALDDFLKALILCHNAIVSYDTKLNQDIFETPLNEELAALEFTKNFGFQYKNISSKPN